MHLLQLLIHTWLGLCRRIPLWYLGWQAEDIQEKLNYVPLNLWNCICITVAQLLLIPWAGVHVLPDTVYNTQAQGLCNVNPLLQQHNYILLYPLYTVASVHEHLFNSAQPVQRVMQLWSGVNIKNLFYLLDRNLNYIALRNFSDVSLSHLMVMYRFSKCIIIWLLYVWDCSYNVRTIKTTSNSTCEIYEYAKLLPIQA